MLLKAQQSAQFRYIRTCITNKKEFAWSSDEAAGSDCSDPEVNLNNLVNSKSVALNQWSFCSAEFNSRLFEFCFLTSATLKLLLILKISLLLSSVFFKHIRTKGKGGSMDCMQPLLKNKRRNKGIACFLVKSVSSYFTVNVRIYVLLVHYFNFQPCPRFL